MAKLGQQVSATEQAQTQQRVTRSERLQAQREAEKFEALRQQAIKVQEEQFKDKTVSKEETYYTYRPKEYSEREWARMSDSSKQAILRQYERGRGLDYYADRGVLVRTAQTRTVTETIPFTLDQGENSYENIYASLSPELKQFFTSPETLKQERSTRIQGNITNVDDRISMAKIRIQELDQKYQQRRQELQDWWSNKSSEYRSKESNRENYKRNLRDLEDDYEEDKEQQRGIIEGLEKGKGKLSQGEDIDFNAILDYANELGSYYEEREDARNSNREAQRKALKELEQRNKEAQAKGFTMTGTIQESFVDPKTGKETVKGTKYFIGGAEVAPSAFAKQFDIYEKPSGGRLIVSKGTDLAKLSPEQQKKLFPVEYEIAEREAQKLSGRTEPTVIPVNLPPELLKQGPTLAPGKSTRTDLAPTMAPVKIYTEPYLESRQVDRFYDDETGKYIPITKVFFVDPTVTGKQFEREATPEEASYFRQQTNVLQASTEKPKFYDPALSKLRVGYQTLNKDLKDNLIGDLVAGFEDITKIGGYEEREKRIAEEPDATKRFFKGAGSGLLEDIKQKPLKNVVLFGAGALIGGAVAGTVSGVSAGTTALFGQTAGRSATVLTKTAIAGTAVYFGAKYASNVYGQVVSAPTAQEKGAILAINVKDFTLIAGGSAVGAKAFEVVKGYVVTRGRTEFPIENVVPKEVLSGQKQFVGAKSARQEFALTKDSPFKLSGQKSTAFGDIKDPSGIYHATASRFSTKEPLAIQPGTSELPGLFGTYAGNIRYLRLSGKYTLFSKGYFNQPGKPAFEYLIPKGYRVNPAVKSAPYKVSGSNTVFRLDFAKGVKEGFADLPLNKLPSEAQAIIRVGSAQKGQYLFQGGEFYTTFRGVRIPIDVFRYVEGSQVAVSKAVAGSGGSGGSGSSAYFLPRYSLLNPESIVLASFASSQKQSYSGGSIASLNSYLASFVSSDIPVSPYVPSASPSGSGGSGGSGSSPSPSFSLTPSIPSVTPPSSPTPSPPSSPPTRRRDFDQELAKLMKKLKQKRGGRFLYYTQDFTSKIVDLPPVKVKQANVEKLIRKIQTGAEIRPPVIVVNGKSKRNKNLERQLQRLMTA